MKLYFANYDDLLMKREIYIHSSRIVDTDGSRQYCIIF